MRTLYFLRHGLADRAEFTGKDDALRPLTAKGRLRMQATAATLARMGWKPGLILTSPLTRARQTAEIVAEGLDLQDRVKVAEELGCGFDSRDLAALLSTYRDTDGLVLVGHEPDFSLVIANLTGGSDIVMKKGGLARVDLFAEDPPAGRLAWLLPPRLLAR
ncbi:MAG: phosphohistidine phosphatase SixA [bacterium]